MKKGWKTYLLYAGTMISALLSVYIIAETIRARNTGFETKTLWDWMELLIIPAVLAGGAIWLNRSERESERRRAEERARLEREIAADRQQEAALQAYLDRMTELLLKDKLRLTKNKEARNVARTRTLTVLRGLDSKRKGSVLRFLFEANLIDKRNPMIDIETADLNDADLYFVNLSRAVLDRVNFKRANFYYAWLEYVSMNGTDFEGANMQFANLFHAHLPNCTLKDVDLRNATLVYADLDCTDLSNSDLSGAVLTNASLIYANLLNAKITPEQLKDVKNLKGATLPDGTIHK